MQDTEEGPERGPAAKTGGRAAIVTLVSLSHAMNHIQTGVLYVIYPLLRDEFGFSYLGIGFLETAHQSVGSVLQAAYGFFARFTGRGVLLGVGNIVNALGIFGLGFARGYSHLVAGVAVRSLGSSAQHPVGAATLADLFKQNRARILGFHQSAGNVGSWLAPIIAASLLLVMDWRQVLQVVALLSFVMGAAYFAFRELMVPAASQAGGSQRKRTLGGLADYKAVLKDRNTRFLTLAMLAGAAGRGTNVLAAYLTTYLVDRYQMEVSQAGMFFAALMVGGIIGPVGVGWVADRVSHKLVAQLSLAAAAAFTFTIVFHPAATWVLGAHLALAGVFMYARGPLLETLFTRATDKATLDTLLSIFYAVSFISGPMWTLVAGIAIDRWGFAPAFGIMAASYLLGMAFLAFVRFAPLKAGRAGQP